MRPTDAREPHRARAVTGVGEERAHPSVEPLTPNGRQKPPQLRTARLVLREWRESDKPEYAALNADPVVMAHFPSTLTAEQSGEMVDRMASGWALRGFGLWAAERIDTGELIGFIGLASPTWTEWFTPCVEVGWRLAQQHWGRGFALEGARAAVQWGFDNVEPPSDEIVSFTTRANVNSRRVMEKLGFSHNEADDFDHPMLPDRAGRRHVLYRMSRSRWEQRGTA